MVKFLSDPKGYLPGDGFLEMEDLRKVVKDTCEGLFPQVEDQVAQAAQPKKTTGPAKSLIFPTTRGSTSSLTLF
jgi:hypothetical protein